MSTDDDLERRIRDALTAQRASDHVDADDFLAGVHRGARFRRVKHRTSVTLGTALLVAGGGLAIDASGILSGSGTPVAGPPTGVTTQALKNTGTGGSGASTSGYRAVRPVKIAARGPISATEVTPVSLTATGTKHQWVLAKTPGDDCGRASCATVFSTTEHGHSGSWQDLGQLPVAPSTSDQPTKDSVSALRFALRQDSSGVYDGWAYGDELWSTHDSGQTWSAKASPPGQVTQLESWGGDVYAAVTLPAGSTSPPTSGATTGASDGPGSTSVAGSGGAVLYRSPATVDDWQPVDVGQPLTDVVSLAAAQQVVGLIDSNGIDSTLYVSADGTTWESQQPCPAETQPRSLSTAGDTETGVSSLWVTCSNATTTVVRYMDTDDWGHWVAVRGHFGGAVMIAARTNLKALAAGAGIDGIQSLSAAKAPVALYSGPVGVPVYFGFTNATYGYLLDSSGAILSTTDGGRKWLPYAVSSTTP